MILGISVDRNHARAVLTDAPGEVIARAEAVEQEPADAIVAVAREAMASDRAQPDAIGVAFPEPDPRSWPADLSYLSAAVGERVPIKVLSLGNAAVLAEMWYGAGRGVRDLIALSAGLCVSAGVVSNGTVLAGAHGVASSVAWLALNPVERDDYRRLGCLEAEGGSAGIIRRLVWRIKSGDQSRVLEDAGSNFADITIDDILAAARAGDDVSSSVIRDTVKYLAMAVSNIAVVVDPEVIVLGGLLQSARDLFFDPIRQECARRMPPGIQERVRIGLSQLGADAAAVGAARFALTGTQLP